MKARIINNKNKFSKNVVFKLDTPLKYGRGNKTTEYLTWSSTCRSMFPCDKFGEIIFWESVLTENETEYIKALKQIGYEMEECLC